MELHKVVVRALFAYVVLLALMRFSGKRSVSQAGAASFVVALIIGDLIDDVLWAEVSAGEFAAASGGIVLTGLVVALVTHLSPAAASVLEGRPSLVLREGAPVRAGMRVERVNEKELAGLLRVQGIEQDRWAEVKGAWVETSGQLSAILREGDRPAQRRDGRRVVRGESA